jgi:ABC-type transport system involved in cytochrome c biogenesis ATPase subunit
MHDHLGQGGMIVAATHSALDLPNARQLTLRQ